MEGFSTFYGNVVSQYADQQLDLVGIDRMFGLSQNDNLNTLAAQRYKHEFGKKKVFVCNNHKKDSPKQKASEDLEGNALFNSKLTYSKLASMLAKGAEIKATNLSDNFTAEQYMAMHGNRLTPLFVITGGQKLIVLEDVDQLMQYGQGATVLGLIKAEEHAQDSQTETSNTAITS